jgi:hypothetical protein
MYDYYKDRTLEANQKIVEAKKEAALIEHRKIEKILEVKHKKSEQFDQISDSTDDESLEELRGKSFSRAKIGLGK